MYGVFTISQSTKGVHFFTGLFITKEMDPSKKILVCEECEHLLNQWKTFEQSDVSVSKRKYILPNSHEKNKHFNLSFICKNVLNEGSRKIYCKYQQIQPFFPFFEKHSLFINVLDVDLDGFTLCCKKCSNFLSKQWNEFENLETPQQDRVYIFEELQPVILKSFFEKNVILTCYVFMKKKNISHMKRIYCNDGANTNLGFLSNFTYHRSESFYVEDTGEIFVCLTCYEDLRQHWFKYRAALFNDPISGFSRRDNINDKRTEGEVCKSKVPSFKGTLFSRS